MTRLLILNFIFLILISSTLSNPVKVDNAETSNSAQYIENIIKLRKQNEFNKSFKKEQKKSSRAVDLSNCSLDQSIIDEIHSYQSTVDTIIEHFITESFKGVTYDALAELTDTFGSRHTGSAALENAIDWILNRATQLFFDGVFAEPVTAPHWERNNESLYLTNPRTQKLPLLGLGSTIGTEGGGITANALVVTSFDDLTSKAYLATGKIVVYNVPFTTYGETAQYRTRGAREAAKVGAVASLVRSVADFSIASPHTGGQSYAEGVTEIPTACISLEDAEMLYRMQTRGEIVTLHLEMGAVNYVDVQTRNAIIEITGTESPEEVVVVSGHIDSWDVGTGAMDDGGGCAVSLIAAEALLALDLKPRRTFRTVLFTAEEQGIFGGDEYFRVHGTDSANFQIMMESDFGTFYPRGIAFSGNQEASCMMNEIVSLTSLIDTNLLVIDAETPDLGAFSLAGVPTGSLVSDSENYFWYHHSEGDTMAVQDSDTMDRVAALWTSVSYVLADVSFRLPHGN